MQKKVQLGDLKPGQKFRFIDGGTEVIAEGFKPMPESFYYRYPDDGPIAAGSSWTRDREVYVEEETVTITLTREVAEFLRNRTSGDWTDQWKHLNAALVDALKDCQC